MADQLFSFVTSLYKIGCVLLPKRKRRKYCNRDHRATGYFHVFSTFHGLYEVRKMSSAYLSVSLYVICLSVACVDFYQTDNLQNYQTDCPQILYTCQEYRVDARTEKKLSNHLYQQFGDVPGKITYLRMYLWLMNLLRFVRYY